MMSLPSASSTAYIVSAFVVGVIVAGAQGFALNTAEGFGAVCGTALGGALFGFIYSFFKKTSIPKWMFWWSLVSMVIQSAAIVRK